VSDSTSRPIRLVILCSWGATSSQLARKVQEAARRRGIELVADAGGTGEFKKKAGQFDVALLEPQVRHLKGEVERVAAEHGIPGRRGRPTGLRVDGRGKVLDQVLALWKGRDDG